MTMTNQPITIRPATKADLAEVVAMLLDDHLGQQREGQAGVDAAYETAFAAIQKEPNNTVFVAEQNGEIVGTFQFILIPSLSFNGGIRCQIESVRTVQHLRGQGIGREMMVWAIERARVAGCVLVQLSTHKSRERAHHFYEQLGFAKSHEGMKLMLR